MYWKCFWLKFMVFFLFGLVKLISGYQNLKSTCPKGYQGFWNFASPAWWAYETLVRNILAIPNFWKVVYDIYFSNISYLAGMYCLYVREYDAFLLLGILFRRSTRGILEYHSWSATYIRAAKSWTQSTSHHSFIGFLSAISSRSFPCT